jgi:hypothetical protein
MKPSILVLASVVGVSSVASAQSAAELMSGLDTVKKGPSQAGLRDCEKADADQNAHFEQNMDNPAAAVFGGAKLACTYLERIAWKAPSAKQAPKAKGGRRGELPSAADVVARAADFWAGADDMYYVKVLSGGVIGTAWRRNEMSDTPGVPSSRDVDVFHVVAAAVANDQTNCFVIYGALHQENLNHPDGTKPPAWSASEYKATDFQRAQKIACPKGAKAPKPPPAE